MAKTCVMLAAGLSSRMGKWKMMMPWGEGTILDSALDSALAFCDRVILVTGFRGDELAAWYQGNPAIKVVYNPNYQAGMFSSIQCGVSHIRAQRFFLALGDMPEVTTDVYRTLWARTGRDTCFIPAYEKGKGHPVLLPQRAIGFINNAPDGSTLRDVIKQMETHIVPVSAQGIHWDVDTPVQYQQIAHLSHKHLIA
nr:NTP transferase domain-containing protein [Cedecea colo]